MNKLILMCGIPGSGKSTWLQKYAKEYMVVSRDVIRFSMVKEDEEYFSKENEVFKEFCRQITEGLKKENVYVDATHLNRASRTKLINNVVGYEEINVIYFKIPLETALKRNENRKGTRAYVPESVIKRMYEQMTTPSFEEGFEKILIIDENEKMTLIKKED